jgi:error-prone DNA polymerase
MEAKRQGIRAHIGAEVGVSDLGERLRPPTYLPHQWLVKPVRLPLLAESRAGYKNLCRLITRFKLRESSKAAGAALASDFEEFGDGLVVKQKSYGRQWAGSAPRRF